MSSVCAEPGCHRGAAIWRKVKTDSRKTNDRHLRFCSDHNKCKVCGKGSSWDAALCYGCDTNK